MNIGETKILTEEDFVFTKSEQTKIEQLRKEREEAIQKKNEIPAYQPKQYKISTPVFVTIDGVSFSGYIIKIEGEWINRKFNVATPHGVLTELTGSNLNFRNVDDLSHVVIPESVSKMSTKELLSKLRILRSYRYYGDDDGYYYNNFFHADVLKAELAKREHIPSKKEKKTVAKYKSKTK